MSLHRKKFFYGMLVPIPFNVLTASVFHFETKHSLKTWQLLSKGKQWQTINDAIFYHNSFVFMLIISIAAAVPGCFVRDGNYELHEQQYFVLGIYLGLFMCLILHHYNIARVYDYQMLNTLYVAALSILFLAVYEYTTFIAAKKPAL